MLSDSARRLLHREVKKFLQVLSTLAIQESARYKLARHMPYTPIPAQLLHIFKSAGFGHFTVISNIASDTVWYDKDLGHTSTKHPRDASVRYSLVLEDLRVVVLPTDRCHDVHVAVHAWSKARHRAEYRGSPTSDSDPRALR